MNCKLTECVTSVGDKVNCSSNLVLFVRVLIPDKDVGQVDDTFFFLRCIDWFTDINKKPKKTF